jgi:hypothetical protein
MSLESLETLAALKCNAIANRGARKDFIDLYALLQSGWDLKRILEATHRHAPSINIAHLLHSLVYFQDAEIDPMPKLYQPWQWSHLKENLEQTVHVYLQEQLQSKTPTPLRDFDPTR